VRRPRVESQLVRRADDAGRPVQVVSTGPELWDAVAPDGRRVGQIRRDGGRLVFEAEAGAVLTAEDLVRVSRVARGSRWRA
jgi:hypothetical protein